MGRSVWCRFGLHRWDQLRDETAHLFRTCRRCGADRGRDRADAAAVGRVRAFTLLPASALVVVVLMASWLLTRR